MKYALEYGADSIYLGLPDFSLRTRINDFTPQKLAKAITYAHERKKKVYVTVNIYAHNKHLAKTTKVLQLLNKLKPDAVVISDPGILVLAKKYLKGIDLHLSTQANTTNWQTAKFWYEQGVTRIILARELSLNEIAEIHKKVPKLELESFVHGAMCVSYSGRCLLSSWFNQRSANLGDCSHPCRWDYNVFIEEQQRPGVYVPIEEDKHGTYILSSKDLCMIKYLDKLAQAGVKHFKIEGRTKSISYLANVVKIYRQAVDLHKNKKISLAGRKKEITKLYKELHKISNREFTTGFYFGGEKLPMQKYDAPYVRPDFEFCGEILGVKKLSAKDGSPSGRKDSWQYKIKVHNIIKMGEQVEFIVPQADNFKTRLPKLYDLDKKDYVAKAHGGQNKTILINLKQKIPLMSILRKKK
ncbi:U32 family peptidase C-terminal domain-containing protein [Patescibacteria group bacterium]